MIDLDALAAACGNATRPRIPDDLAAAAGLPVVHVITELGPYDHAAILKGAVIGYAARSMPAWSVPRSWVS